MSLFSKKLNSLPEAGFTLIELLVVIAIFTTMTAIILANLPQFRDQTALELLAQQMGMNIRVAQVYSIGTRLVTNSLDPANPLPNKDRFNWYGIHYDLSVNKSEFKMFADVDRNGHYNADRDIVESIHTLIGGYEIKGICLRTVDNNCTEVTGKKVSIVYRRPDPEATLCIDTSDCSVTNEVFTDLLISIGRVNDPPKLKRIIVSSNGQIAVEPGYQDPISPSL